MPPLTLSVNAHTKESHGEQAQQGEGHRPQRRARLGGRGDRTHGWCRRRPDLHPGAGGLAVNHDTVDGHRSRTARPPTIGLETRISIHLPLPSSLVGEAGGHVTHRLNESIRARSFLALGVSALHHDSAIESLHRRCGATVVDATQVLVEAMRREAASIGLDWDTVTAADAAEPNTRAAAGLASLVNRTVPAVHQAIADAGRDVGVPVLITEAAPLARYGHLATLSRWTDLAAPRPTAIWLLVPQLHGTTGGLVDGKPLPLGAPGQFIQLDEEWLTSMPAEDVAPAGSATT